MKSEKELREEYIESILSKRFFGWFWTISCPLVSTFFWIFGNKELWSLEGKISATIIFALIFYSIGLREIIESNKKLKEEGYNENKN